LTGGGPSPDFSLSANPGSVSMAQGSSAPSTITVTPSGGFTGQVTLSASGLPTGVTAGFATNPTSGSSVVTFTAAAGAAVGPAVVTIKGVSGAITHTTTVNLSVAGTGGTLNGSGMPAIGPIGLTSQGSIDWAHWGFADATSFDHKSGGDG